MKRVIAASVMAILSVGVSLAGVKATVPDSAVKMSPKEVKKMASDSTASGDGSYGKFSIYFKNNGRLIINKPDDNDSDTGKWYVNKAGALCTKFDHWADSQEKCRTFYRVGGEFWGYEANGKVRKYQKIDIGNATGITL